MSLAKTTATLLIALSLASTTHGIASLEKDVHTDTIEASHAEPEHVEEHHRDLHEDDSHVAVTPDKKPEVKLDDTAKLKDKEFHSDVFDHINHEEQNKSALVPSHESGPEHDGDADYDEYLEDDEGHHIKKHVHGGPGFEAISIKSDGPLKPQFIQHMMQEQIQKHMK